MNKKNNFLAAILIALSTTSFAADIFKISFGPTYGVNPDYNVIGITGSSDILIDKVFNLKDSLGASSAITFSQKTGQAFAQAAPSPETVGFSYNFPYFSAAVCYSWCFNFSASTTFDLAGFTSSDVVDLVILCSRGNNGSTPYTTSRLCNLTATGSNVVTYNNYEPAGNYTQLATLSNVRPTATGKITLKLESANGATLMNAIRIKRSTGSQNPDIVNSVAAISSLNYAVNNGPSPVKTFTVSGSLLQSDIVVTPSQNLEISNSSTTGFASAALTLTQTGGAVASTNLYVRLKAGLNSADYRDSIMLTSTNALKKRILCMGTVSPPEIVLSATSLDKMNYIEASGPSVERILTVSGIGLSTGITLTSTANIEISKTTAAGFTNSITLAPSGGVVASTNIFVRLKTGLNVATYNEEINIASTGLSAQKVLCTGAVSAAPSPSTNAARISYIDFGTAALTTTDEGWNNMTNFSVNQSVNLVDAAAKPFGAITITAPFAGSNTAGTSSTTESEVYIFTGNPSLDAFYGQLGATSALKLTGLNPSARYNFTLFGSRFGLTTIDNRETKYVVTGINGTQTVLLLDATNNNSKSVVAKNIIPTAAGEITIEVSAGSNNTSSSQYYYLNAMKILEITGNIVESSNGQYLKGDMLEPWCGGPAYYSKWNKGLSSNNTFFPKTVFYQQTSYINSYKNVGINSFSYWDPATTSPSTLDLLKAAGFYGLNPYSNAYRDYVGAGASSMACWYIPHDEPDNAQTNGQPVPIEQVMTEYKTIVDNDANRPVVIGLGQGAAVNSWYGRGFTNRPRDYRKYSKWADIVSFDTYPMNERPAVTGDAQYIIDFRSEIADHIWYVANGVDNLREATDYSKPIMAWIETTNFHSYPNSVYSGNCNLSPAHIKAEVWMALIHGARGIGYFCHILQPSVIPAGILQPEYAANLQAVTSVNAEIEAYATILNTQTVSNGATVNTGNKANPVDIMVKRVAGFTYIFAVSMRPGTPTATFSLRDLAGNSSVEVVGENRTITAVNGVFQDAFTNYGVHIYKVSTINTAINEITSDGRNFKITKNQQGHVCFESNNQIERIEVISLSGATIYSSTVNNIVGEMYLPITQQEVLIKASFRDKTIISKLLLR